MKTSWIAMLLFSTVIPIHVQTSASARPADTAYAIVSRDASSRTWQRTNWTQDTSGEWVPHVHSYVELQTGLHYMKEGKWTESKEQIEIKPRGGAAATRGQYQVYFPGDIYRGFLEIVTPEGLHLKNRPLGISYYDGTNSVLIAELTNSLGQLISGNQVIYTNAFTDFAADLVMTYRKSGLECDLVLREQVPPPEVFGLNSANTRMELLTEFFGTPDPEEVPAAANRMDKRGDTTLKFGSMTMVRGKAFEIGVHDKEAGARATRMDRIPVSKTWERIEGRTFLIEAVPVSSLSPNLKNLPRPTGSTHVVSVGPALRKLSASRLLPPMRIAQRSTNVMRVATADLHRKPSIVWDYNLVNSQDDMIFQGDTTYRVSGAVNLSGVTVIEGGAVIKYDPDNPGSVNILETVQCKTGPYHPAVFTSINDSSVGEQISSSDPPCTAPLNLYIARACP